MSHEVRIDLAFALVSCGLNDSGLNRSDARLPRIVVERPAETLHANHWNRDGNASIDRSCQICLHPTFGKADQADVLGVYVIACFQIIQQPQDIPHRVVKEWMFLAGAICAQDCVSIRKITVASVASFPVIAPVNRYANEAALSERLEFFEKLVLRAPCAMQGNNNGALAGNICRL